MSTMVGEALVGSGKEVAHIDLIVGEKGSPVEAAFANSLANPVAGHTPLLAVLEPNLPAKPYTLMVNKVSIKNVKQALMHFGPAQAAVAKAVVDSVADAVIPQGKVDDYFIVASVFIEWDAEDKDKVYKYNYEAVKLALRRAFKKEPTIKEILAGKEKAKHPFR
jgi:5,6,7,8-tetrahydromethanopterin hydro-lyase